MPEEPEKLTIGGNGYDDEGGNFELQASSMYGTGTAAGNTTFEIVATLTITDASGLVDTVRHTEAIVPVGDVAPGASVPLRDTLIPWDRKGGTYTGTVDVATSAHLTKNGNKVGNSDASHIQRGIAIGGRSDPG